MVYNFINNIKSKKIGDDVMELSIIINIIIVIPFIVLGIYFMNGKWVHFLEKYTIISEDEKEEYDMKSFGKFIGVILFVIALCISLWGISEIEKIEELFTLGTCLFFMTLICALVYLNAEESFKR